MRQIKTSEASIQKAIVQALRWQFPNALVAHIANGGRRDLIEAAKLKSQGVTAGVPDLVVCLPGGKVIWLEVKNAAGRLSDAQRLIRQKLDDLGHPACTVRSVDEALAFVRQVASA